MNPGTKTGPTLANSSMSERSNRDGHPLSDVVEHVKSASDGKTVTVGKIAEKVGRQDILPLLLLPSLIAATPLSGIPGVSVVCGLLIALLSAELIFGFRDLYLPSKLDEQSVNSTKLRSMLNRIAPAIDWIERHTGNRLSFLFHRPFIWVPQVFCLVSGLAMPFLEFIPFSSSVVAIGVCFLVMSMLTKDGLFFILALFPYAAAAYLLVQVIP